ncbi:MAG: hypothetical protein IKW59_09175 [Clostridia bacterium]|nr:hypothetical protein [Clostridia bacterium]
MIYLKKEMPDYVVYEGERYMINTDFRVWINTENILYSELPWFEKIIELFKLCYKDNLPPDANVAFKLLINFYCGGSEVYAENKIQQGTFFRVFDFEFDAELIYAAFMQQYRIDLTEEELHWWKFLALFRSVGQDTKLFSVMQWRAMDLSVISDKNQKEHYRNLKRIYRLPSRRLGDGDSELAEMISQMME